MFVEGRTWRCTLEGCAFFVHKGLAHLLPGKDARCWECGEIFKLDETALKDDMPKCSDCRTGVSADDISKMIELREKEARRKKLESYVPKREEPDQIEIIEPSDEGESNE